MGKLSYEYNKNIILQLTKNKYIYITYYYSEKAKSYNYKKSVRNRTIQYKTLHTGHNTKHSNLHGASDIGQK